MTTSWRSCELAGNGGAGEWIRYAADVTEGIERGQQLLLQQQEELTLQFDGFTIQLPQLLHVDSNDGSHRHIARFVGEHLVLGSDEFLACDELECCEVSCFMDFDACGAENGEQQQAEDEDGPGAAVLREVLAAALADPASKLPSLWCFVGPREDAAEQEQLRRLLTITEERPREATYNGIMRHLGSLDKELASFPRELLEAAAGSDSATAEKLVDGICALALYSSDFPNGGRGPNYYAMVNTALRIMGCSGEAMFEFEDAAFLTYQLQPFVDAATWMLREVLPRCREVTFRGIGYELEQPRIGATFPQACFGSTSPEHDAVQRFARRTLMVLMTQSGASISFASFFGEEETEILLPPGVELEVVARASATLLSVLHFEPGKHLLTLREVGMRPTPSELFKAARAVLPIYETFSDMYQLPSLLSQDAKEVMRLFGGEAGGGAAIGGEAGGGAAAGNSNNNQHAMRLDAALDQNIISSGSDMLIIADGGTGKTAAAVFAQVHLSRQDAGRRLLPIFLPLSRLKQDDVTRRGGLDAALAGALGCDVETLLQTARRFSVVAILDSLDETMVKDEHWAGLLERNPAAQQCRVIMTSRPTPLATEQHQRIFGSARRVQVLDLLPLPQPSLNRIVAHLTEFPDAELPAALLASGDATPLLASFAATLVNKQAERLQSERGDDYDLNLRDITILDGIAGQRELLELYLQHTCDLPQAALSKLCLNLLARGFHCTLGVAKRVAEAADVASRVPCRVEDEFDDGADFSLLHRSLVEHVVAREVAAERLSFDRDSTLRKMSPVLLTGVTRMLLADAQCPFGVRLHVVQHLVNVDQDPSALELAQEMLAEAERRAGGQPSTDVAKLLGVIGTGFRDSGDLPLGHEFSERAVRLFEGLYEREQDPQRQRVLGVNLAAACGNLAIIYGRQKNYAAAQQHYERAIELKERHGENTVGVARTRENLAGVFLEKGDPARALQEFERCLAIFEAHLGRGHHQVAKCLNNVGQVHVALGQPARAVPLLQRALEIHANTLPVDHVYTSNVHSLLGDAYRALANKPDARRHYQEAVRIARVNGQLARAQRDQCDLDAMGT